MKREDVQKALGVHSDVLEVQHLIGCGSFGSVWLASDRTLGGRQVALKVLDRLNDYEGVKAYAGGVKQHPNLLQIFFCDICAEKLFYAMELADNAAEDAGDYRADTLAGRLVAHAVAGTHPSTEEIRTIILGLLDGLETMHSCGYCHRDIKPENVIFVAGVPKLSDVGSVRRIVDADTSGVTPCYMPPEMCEGKYDPVEHDLYSIGMLVYCMLALRGGDEYPILDDLNLLKDKTCRRLNDFITEHACSNDPALRYHDIASFRADFERCFYRPPVAKLVTGGIFLTTVFILLGLGLYWHSVFESDQGRHALKLSAPITIKSSVAGVHSAWLRISEEIRREELPLKFILPDVPPGATLRIAPTEKSEIPEKLRDVYGSWSDWSLYPCCSVMFLRGRGAAVTYCKDFRRSHMDSRLFGDLLNAKSREVEVEFSSARADGVDLKINGQNVVEDFVAIGSDPVRMLIGVSYDDEQ